MEKPSSVVVIGAGIVGAATGYRLARAGYQVTIIDKGTPGSGTSHGNAGGIVPGAMPLGTVSALKSLPRRLMDPNSALAIRWGDFPHLLPWLARFIGQCTPSRAEANSIALYALTSRSPEAWRELSRGTAAETLFRPRGWLKVFESEQNLITGTAELRDVLDRRGGPYDILDQDALRQYEPSLSTRFTHGFLQPDGICCVNPRRLTETMVAEATARGATFEQAEVADIETSEDGPRVILADGRAINADRVVVAAGVLSNRLSRKLGTDVPLRAERGYHLMFDTPSEQPHAPIVWGETDVVICPMEAGLRVTSMVELSHPDSPPNYQLIERKAAMARAMLPSLGDAEPREKWMGCRPSLPDSRPVIGASEKDPRVLLAFGHNHYGLTLSAITAELVQCLIEETEPPVPLLPYRAIR